MSDIELPTEARSGFFPVVSGERVDLQQSGALAVFAGGDLTVSQGGGQLFVAAGDISIEQGGGQTLVAKGDLSIHNGGALAAAAATVKIDNSWVGVAIGGRVQLTASRVLLGPLQALSLGAGLGIVLTLAHRLFRHTTST